MAPASQIRVIAAGLALVFAPPLAGAARADPPAVAVASELARQVTELSEGWRFRFGTESDAVTGSGFDDSGWAQVSVPHTWNRVGEYAVTRSAVTNNAQGVGWYRLSYQATPAAKGKRQYLDFAAVGAIADVWVNGVHVGQHKGAFSRFRIDVTAAWKPGATNLIAVKADNSKPAVGSSTEHVIPLAGDFFVEGGIYRGVSLITANDVGIDLLDMGGPGIYARTSEVTDGNAFVEVVTRLRNSSSRARTLTVNTRLTDANGKEAGFRSTVVPVRAGATANTAPTLNVLKPQLWGGLADPRLYAVTSEIWEGKRLLDRVTQPFGFRTIRVDPNQGFFLNGRPLPLHGVSRHQDRMGKGWALSRADHKVDMGLIADMGANTVRMAHYQHDDAWADEADAHGMIAWAEIPYVTTPSLSGGQGSPELWANAEQQLRELIRQMYNHPSIAMWSIGNEVDAAHGFGIAGAAPKPLALLQHLQKVAREEDPSRATTFADCCEDVGMMQTAGEPLAGTADLIGYNRYYGWYMPKPLDAREQLGRELDRLHAKHPALPISISEYGAGGATSQHSDNVLAGFVNFIGRPQPEEFQSFVHEQTWPAIRDRKFAFASWVWNMFDFVSDLRGEGDSVDLNTKGLVTFDRKVKKDAFYYYQAQWSDRTMVHINSARYADRAYPVTDVRIYSNAPTVSLSVGGVDLGSKACDDKVCVWPGVALKPGPNRVTASVSVGRQLVADSVTWNGPDPAKGIRIEAGDSAGRLLDGRRYGSDNFVTGGTPQVLNIGSFGGRGAPRKDVIAPHPELYDYWREGEAFSYAIPLADGKWTVTIHSFEPRADASPATVMTVAANGRSALPAFNVAKIAGGSLRGIARSFPVRVHGGVLKLDFSATGGKAVVAAIEIMR